MGFWERGWAYFVSAGITVERVLTDNGMRYRPHARWYLLACQEVEHKRTRPYRIQRLLNQAVMDETALTSALRGYVINHLGTQDVVLVIDETGDLKKGAHTVGAARQSPPAATRPGGTPRHHGPDRELPGRGLPRLHHTRCSRPDRPPPLPPGFLGR